MANKKETLYDKSKRIKGYGFKEYEEEVLKKEMMSNQKYTIDSKTKNEIEKVKKSADGKLTVKPIVIESLEDYIKHISELDYNFFNPILYRGHTNANYLMLPSVMRDLYKKENLLYEEFCRRFPNEIIHCENTMEKLVFMQHYKTLTRSLDLSENPLFGLFFACADDKRFRVNDEGDKYRWGEVILIRAPETEENKQTNYHEDIKYSNSSTVSVLANTGYMDECFNLKKLQIQYQNDRHQANYNNFIYIRDILRRSVIVRTKQDNRRIEHQQGAFIIVNANEIEQIYCDEDVTKKEIVDIKSFTDFVLNEETEKDVNIDYLQRGFYPSFTQFEKEKEYNIHFRKIEPYSLNNSDSRMQNDPFDLRRLLYKNSDGIQVVFLIPPTAKEKIKNQLQKLNITDAFVYPEMDSVSNELIERFRSAKKQSS